MEMLRNLFLSMLGNNPIKSWVIKIKSPKPLYKMPQFPPMFYSTRLSTEIEMRAAQKMANTLVWKNKWQKAQSLINLRVQEIISKLPFQEIISKLRCLLNSIKRILLFKKSDSTCFHNLCHIILWLTKLLC